MLRAFSRTRALRGPGRADVDIAMSKWWTKKRPTEGQVRLPSDDDVVGKADILELSLLKYQEQ